ncbi:MAG: asparagine synthetase B family protein, partial [Caulobacteraceae bacterium]
REERLTLARDRLGEKPLYWAEHAGGLAFASELTSLEALPGLDLGLSRPAISAFLRLGYVPAPLSILAGAAKLTPGWRLDWRANEGAKLAPYWSLAQVIEAGAEAPLSDPDAAVAELERLLGEVVAEQMVADVPLGVFLSGGIDSSTVAAMMSKAAQAPIKTFTIGFSEPRFDESAHAEAVAAHLGAEHRTHIFTTADAQALAPDLAAKWDEPFADPSQIPTLLLAAMARDEVKVCLTGDGGDEMFAGYVRYWGVPKLWRAVRRAPLRGCAAALAQAAPLALLEAGSGFFAGIGEDYAARGRMAPALRKAAGWIGARSEEELYERTMSAWFDPEVLTGAPLRDPAAWRGPGPRGVDPLCAMQWRDAIDYLPGDILCKLDRAAMSVSLETRAPLLDARIAAFAFRLPEVMKVRGGVGKWLLREVLARHVPRGLFER